MGTPLVIDDEVREQIKALIELAESCPVDMPVLMRDIKYAKVKKAHVAQMTRQTIKIPLAYMVTFSVELNHPCGKCRHMSMSVDRFERVPSPEGVWMVAQELGFWGGLFKCTFWQEKLKGHGLAINLVQPYEQPKTNPPAEVPK